MCVKTMRGVRIEKGRPFGSDQQKGSGSVRTDIWRGDVASKGCVVFYRVGGWWKNRRFMDQSDGSLDYPLVVNIESPSIDVDLWVLVDQKVRAVTRVSV